MRKLVLVVAALALVGCGDDDSRMGMDGGSDAFSGVDTGGVDTGMMGVDTNMMMVDTGVDTGGMTAMCPAGACNLETNAGCAAGEGCYWDGTMPVCVAAGSAGTGAACSAPNDCQEGHVCQNDVCVLVCCGGSDLNCNTAAGETCLNFAGEGGVSLGFGACITPSGCSLLTQDCTRMGTGCYPIGGDGSTDCLGAGTDAEGEECTASNSCAPGLVCLADGVCARLCRVGGGEPSCTAPLECGGLSGFDDEGVCVMPS